MKIEDIKIDISPSKSDSNKTTLAYVNIAIPLETEFGSVELKINNFRIMTDSYHKYRNGYRLVPPSIKSGFKYKEIIYFQGNKDFWFQLEGRILQEYEDNYLKKDMTS